MFQKLNRISPLFFLAIAMVSDVAAGAEPTASDVSGVPRIENYLGVARDDGKVVYQEKHQATFLDRQVQRAETRYLNADGKVIGELKSDFTKLITTPEYDYKDLRTGNSHGIKLQGEKITLWRKSKDGQYEESSFNKDKFSKETLIVGCQGLHYYLIDNLERVKEKKSVPLKYLIPGNLDYYSFTLKIDREDNEYVYLKISIDNLVLKMFTSSLNLKYRKGDRRLVRYEGLSNITNDQDKMQNVIIDYKYD